MNTLFSIIFLFFLATACKPTPPTENPDEQAPFHRNQTDINQLLTNNDKDDSAAKEEIPSAPSPSQNPTVAEESDDDAEEDPPETWVDPPLQAPTALAPDQTPALLADLLLEASENEANIETADAILPPEEEDLAETYSNDDLDDLRSALAQLNREEFIQLFVESMMNNTNPPAEPSDPLPPVEETPPQSSVPSPLAEETPAEPVTASLPTEPVTASLPTEPAVAAPLPLPPAQPLQTETHTSSVETSPQVESPPNPAENSASQLEEASTVAEPDDTPSANTAEPADTAEADDTDASQTEEIQTLLLEVEEPVELSSLPISIPHTRSPGGLEANTFTAFQCHPNEDNDTPSFNLHLLTYRVSELGVHPLCEVISIDTNSGAQTLKALAHYDRQHCIRYVQHYIEENKDEITCTPVVQKTR